MLLNLSFMLSMIDVCLVLSSGMIQLVFVFLNAPLDV